MHIGAVICFLISPVLHRTLGPGWWTLEGLSLSLQKGDGVFIGLLSYCWDSGIADNFLLGCFPSCLYTGKKMVSFPSVIRVIIIPVGIQRENCSFPHWIFTTWHMNPYGIPQWLSRKDSAYNAGDIPKHVFHPCVGEIPWRRAWQPISVFLPGESFGQRSLAGYSE